MVTTARKAKREDRDTKEPIAIASPMLYVVMARRPIAAATRATCFSKIIELADLASPCIRRGSWPRPSVRNPRVIGDSYGQRAEKIEPRSEEAEEDGGRTREDFRRARAWDDGKRRSRRAKAALATGTQIGFQVIMLAAIDATIASTKSLWKRSR